MSQQIDINLPVANLPKAMACYMALGFSHNPQVTGDTTEAPVERPTRWPWVGAHLYERTAAAIVMIS